MKIEARLNEEPKTRFEELHPVQLKLDIAKGQTLSLTIPEAEALLVSLKAALDKIEY